MSDENKSPVPEVSLATMGADPREWVVQKFLAVNEREDSAVKEQFNQVLCDVENPNTHELDIDKALYLTYDKYSSQTDIFGPGPKGKVSREVLALLTIYKEVYRRQRLGGDTAPIPQLLQDGVYNEDKFDELLSAGKKAGQDKWYVYYNKNSKEKTNQETIDYAKSLNLDEGYADMLAPQDEKSYSVLWMNKKVLDKLKSAAAGKIVDETNADEIVRKLEDLITDAGAEHEYVERGVRAPYCENDYVRTAIKITKDLGELRKTRSAEIKGRTDMEEAMKVTGFTNDGDLSPVAIATFELFGDRTNDGVVNIHYDAKSKSYLAAKNPNPYSYGNGRVIYDHNKDEEGIVGLRAKVAALLEPVEDAFLVGDKTARDAIYASLYNARLAAIKQFKDDATPDELKEHKNPGQEYEEAIAILKRAEMVEQARKDGKAEVPSFTAATYADFKAKGLEEARIAAGAEPEITGTVSKANYDTVKAAWDEARPFLIDPEETQKAGGKATTTKAYQEKVRGIVVDWSVDMAHAASDADRQAMLGKLYQKYTENNDLATWDALAILKRSEELRVGTKSPETFDFQSWSSYAYAARDYAKDIAEGKTQTSSLAKTDTKILTFTTDENPADVALAELMGKRESARVIYDLDGVGLDKLNNAVTQLVNKHKEAFLKGTPAQRQAIYKELVEQSRDAAKNNNDNGYDMTIAVLYRAEQIEAQQKAGATSITGFANAKVQGQELIQASWNYGVACNDGKVTDDMAFKAESTSTTENTLTKNATKRSELDEAELVDGTIFTNVTKLEKQASFKTNPNEKAVRAQQKMLAYLGFPCGTYGENKDGVDGKYGPATAQAIHDYKASLAKADPVKFKDLDQTGETIDGQLLAELTKHYNDKIAAAKKTNDPNKDVAKKEEKWHPPMSLPVNGNITGMQDVTTAFFNQPWNNFLTTPKKELDEKTKAQVDPNQYVKGPFASVTSNNPFDLTNQSWFKNPQKQNGQVKG